MEDLFLALFLITFVALVVGLIKPTVFSRFLGDKATRKGTTTIFGVALIVFFILFGVTAEPIEQENTEPEDGATVESTPKGLTNNSEQNNDQIETDTERAIEIPEYIILGKIEHISTRNLEDKASYSGGVLFEENIMDTPPQKLFNIAKTIAETEGLNRNAHFYSTEDAYKTNMTIYLSEEDRELHQQLGTQINENQEYKTPEELEAYMKEGYIGRLEDNIMSFGSDTEYYNRHQAEIEEMDNVEVY